MYDLDKVVNFARYGVMAEHADCLLDFSKGACEVIVRNPFIDAAAAARNAQNHHVQNKSPILPAHFQPVIITPISNQQQQPAQEQQSTVTEPLTSQPRSKKSSSSIQRPPRATCSFCGKSFGHLGDYNKHRRRHTGERPYACDTCPRRFAHASNLQRHRRLHSGEKPFECVTCAKRFSRKDKVAAHMARRCCKPSV